MHGCALRPEPPSDPKQRLQRQNSSNNGSRGPKTAQLQRYSNVFEYVFAIGIRFYVLFTSIGIHNVFAQRYPECLRVPFRLQVVFLAIQTAFSAQIYKIGKRGKHFRPNSEGREIEENPELYAFCIWGYAKGLKRKLPNSIPKLCVGARVTPPEPNAGA